MVHIDGYLAAPVTGLARDAGISHSALSRILSGQAAPSFSLACKVARALGKRLGQEQRLEMERQPGASLPGDRLDPCELFSLDGTYPTPCVCDLVGCPDRSQCWRVRAALRRPSA